MSMRVLLLVATAGLASLAGCAKDGARPSPIQHGPEEAGAAPSDPGAANEQPPVVTQALFAPEHTRNTPKGGSGTKADGTAAPPPPPPPPPR